MGIYIFSVGTASAFCLVAYFNIKTALIVKNIERVYRKEGKNGPFWYNYDAKLKFIFAPNKLIDQKDSDEIRAAKQVLINHGKSIPKQVGWVILVLAFTGVLTILFSIII